MRRFWDDEHRDYDDDHEYRQPRSRTSPGSDSSFVVRSTVYVGDLPPGYGSSELEHVFAEFGEVQSVRVIPGKKFVFVGRSLFT